MKVHRPLGRFTSSQNYHWWVYSAVSIGLFLTVMDQSGINIALPGIADHFNADIPSVQWISLGYVLATSALIMPMGRFSDIIGRKYVLITSLMVFIISAIIGGSSQSLKLLVTTKIVQGFGSSGIQANAMAIITEAFPSSARGKALGMYMAIIGSGAITGPVMGGLLISLFGWRSVFFAGVPVGLLAIVATVLVLQVQTPSKVNIDSVSDFDWIGSILSSACLVTFLLAMTNAWKIGWSSPLIVSGILAGAILMALFVFWESKSANPILDLQFFANHIFSLAIIARFLSFLGGSAVYFLMPFYLIQGLELSPGKAALLMVPASMSMALVGPIIGILSDRIGTRRPTIIGMALSTTAMFMFSRLSLGTPDYLIVVNMIVSGIGMAIFGSPNSSAIMGTVPAEKYGIITAFVNLVRTSANVMGVAIATTIVTFTMVSFGYEPNLTMGGSVIGENARGAFVEGLSRAFLFSSLLMFGAMSLSWARNDDIGVSPQD